MQAATTPEPPVPPIPPTPTIPRVTITQGPNGPVIVSGAGGEPSQVYEAFRNQRSELSDQLNRLEDQRREISQQLQQPSLNSVDEKALEQRLATVDQRIAATEKQLADADANVAKAAAIPGAVVPPPHFERPGPPEEAYVLMGLFIVLVLLPISIAFARRIWKRGAAAMTKLPQDIYDRFARVDQSLDSIAIEVERIGEGQRFLTKMHTEQRGLGAGPAERIETPERERERQSRNPR
jgi:hypothetical protein